MPNDDYYLQRPTFYRPERVRVNQPSTLQPDHALHGRVGVAMKEKGDTDYVTLYFTEGEVHSTRIAISSLCRSL